MGCVCVSLCMCVCLSLCVCGWVHAGSVTVGGFALVVSLRSARCCCSWWRRREARLLLLLLQLYCPLMRNVCVSLSLSLSVCLGGCRIIILLVITEKSLLF